MLIAQNSKPVCQPPNKLYGAIRHTTVPPCCDELTRQATPLLVKALDLNHQWEEAAGSVTLRFPRVDASGFDVALTGNSNDIELAAGGFHSHFDDNPDPSELVKAALGFVRDLLAPSMRLREWCSNGACIDGPLNRAVVVALDALTDDPESAPAG